MVPGAAGSRATLWDVLATLVVVLVAASVAAAGDFASVYRQAAATSPALARARALLKADEAALPLARSNLLPHLSASGGVGEANVDMKGFGKDFGLPLAPLRDSYYDASYSVTLMQPVIDGQAWVGMRQADALIRSGQAAVLAAEQDLIRVVAEGYFGVLQAEADERVSRSHKELLRTVLNQADAFLKVGSGDIIAVQEATAGFDAAEATLIRTQNASRIARQRLERLTHQTLGPLVDLGPFAPEGPNPNQLEPWLNAARDNQPLLNQAREQLKAAQDEVEIQRRAHWPKLNIGAGYSYDKGGFMPSLESNRMRIGVNVSLPLVEGGQIVAKTNRAVAQAKAGEYHLKDLEDQVRLDTESAFLVLQNSVEELLAARQAVNSAQTSLEATRKGYEIGSRSVVDLLKVAHDFETAQRNFHLARYAQVLARLKLKAATGVLCEDDVTAINALLKESEQ